ncbi:glucan endo-1,3-beta-glucosidase 13 [Selaginella moellendorffii]|uniref:glucan endo-1,3-beta-glucosidase 13 n=1 Tax=Selaginella moellendorffii TaxID=88036 RepID=UPI000D1C2B16|nr:glucan endo-1,3-beta-glucosidase 13 [Selaginella moellendorffii]XP_024539941.1 glucan endo-1,3-beta-glucosidase 13 [Selaginella moellendorffii]XP_024539943.1 glucan endo-1,3-beta-glucosidase 13 [Selaginella moellendorffii]XP_024539946.1 glucan endo-1,3-beta-glucosidase 13 [Selaginella moellendorffii]XP_024539953.1 glucan endo-1,3-beta-glucosidase 13 [Selaginella moellendorffii]|eukprot:XP_002962275.2 glucan endo-1,3-beta-glucosidase 13 [Selaginella moellendorffii]
MFRRSYRIAGCLVAACWIVATVCGASSVGVCYGRNGDNLPSPQVAVQLIQAQSITKVRIFSYDAETLQAFANTQIELVIGTTNAQVVDFGQSQGDAADWVTRNVAAALPATKIVAIAVGSEVITSAPNAAGYLVAAMTNIYSALQQAGIDKQVKVSTPLSMGVLGTSFPPSSATFDPRFSAVMQSLLEFLSRTGSYLMANVYPYYAYRNDMRYISSDFALFRPNQGFTDSDSGLHYWNLFDAQLDALYYAMAAYNHREILIVVSETGWPSMGNADEVNVVNLDNAASYNGNLIKHLSNGSGTPFRPGITTDTYIFELFNEDLREGPTSNRNWGLFKPDGTKVYNLDFGNSVVVQRNRSFCVANPNASFTDLQIALDWACGPGHADCQAIQPGQSCYLPDTVASHASYAFNSYFQSNGMDPSACDFSGAAAVTIADPTYGSCIYKGSLMPGKALSARDPRLLLPLAAILFTKFCLL